MLRQASLLSSLPSSQASSPIHCCPSPQRARRSWRQASVSTSPSSQASFSWVMPSPAEGGAVRAGVVVDLVAVVAGLLPFPYRYRRSGCLAVGEQASVSTTLPSSQALHRPIAPHHRVCARSPGSHLGCHDCRRRIPRLVAGCHHAAGTSQRFEQPPPPTSLPSSQSSQKLRMPSPQAGEALLVQASLSTTSPSQAS